SPTNSADQPVWTPSEVLSESVSYSEKREPPLSSSPAIHTIDLRKDFHNTVALRGLSMTVGRGEVFGFLGPNGAGKTTAVKLLIGLIRPSGGEAMVLGAPAGDRETRSQIGYLPELFRYQSWLTAREVLALHCRLLQLPRKAISANVGEALETVGLADRGDDKVGTFSKGMQQRLGLGVALLGQPALVVLDEPTSALDPIGRHDVRQVIRGIRDRGATVFLNTHLLEEAEQVCDRVTVIDKGRSIATGTLSELIGRQSTVRLKVAGLSADWWRRFEEYGRWTREAEWLVVERIVPERVPELVAAIVSLGGLVEAVVPEHQSLEERFLELLGES
ncbi:MAG TPA: ABC transporter ATP-binding protein, partial [Acidimicrobiales bacterium]|nr:ABC transporter ATP-binding protein [Acidimicrobiales bacterium]